MQSRCEMGLHFGADEVDREGDLGCVGVHSGLDLGGLLRRVLDGFGGVGVELRFEFAK